MAVSHRIRLYALALGAFILTGGDAAANPIPPAPPRLIKRAFMMFDLGAYNAAKQEIDQGLVTADDRDADDNTVLHRAAMAGREDIVRLLLSKSFNPNATDRLGRTPLTKAANRTIAETLLAGGGLMLTPEPYCARSALHWVAERGGEEVARTLLDHGAKVDERNRCDGDTALHAASRAGQIRLAAVLLDSRADVNARNERGDTPLVQVSRNRSASTLELAGLLVARGADVNIPGSGSPSEVVGVDDEKKDFAPLHHAALNGDAALAKLLLDSRANVNAASDKGYTPLHLATVGGHLDVARMLLERGARVTARDRSGNTPLHWAALADAGSATDFRTGVNLKDVNLYARIGPDAYLPLLTLFIDQGADLDAANGYGMTPLGLASDRGNEKAAALLRSKGAKILVSDDFTQREKRASAFVDDFFQRARLIADHPSDNSQQRMTDLVTEYVDVSTMAASVMTRLKYALRPEALPQAQKQAEEFTQLWGRKMAAVLAEGLVSKNPGTLKLGSAQSTGRTGHLEGRDDLLWWYLDGYYTGGGKPQHTTWWLKDTGGRLGIIDIRMTESEHDYTSMVDIQARDIADFVKSTPNGFSILLQKLKEEEKAPSAG